MKHRVKSPVFLITAFLILIGTFALMSESDPMAGALFFIPFALGPLFISLAISLYSPYRSCQIILGVSSVVYGVWFSFVFLSAFYWHIDAQSAITLLFIGIYSLPVMIPCWIVSLVLRNKNSRKAEQVGAPNPLPAE